MKAGMVLAASMLAGWTLRAAQPAERRVVMIDFTKAENAKGAWLNAWGGEKRGRAWFDAADGGLRLVYTNSDATFSSPVIERAFSELLAGGTKAEVPAKYSFKYRVRALDGGSQVHFNTAETYVANVGFVRDGAVHEVSLRPGGWNRNGAPFDPAALVSLYLALSGTGDLTLYELGAIYRDYPGNYITNLTLTETYWFDIDPTGSNWCYRAGTVDGPKPVYVDFPGNVVKTNIRTTVAMVITNESATGFQAGLNWAPYVLRSKVPGLDSQMYARGETNTWDAVNFKITADVINGMPLRQKWVPLRYFVFREGSFDADNRSVIDIPHPFSADSLSVNYGWKEYAEHPEKWTLGFSWSIDPRVAPVAIETLAPTNTITW